MQRGAAINECGFFSPLLSSANVRSQGEKAGAGPPGTLYILIELKDVDKVKKLTLLQMVTGNTSTAIF